MLARKSYFSVVLAAIVFCIIFLNSAAGQTQCTTLNRRPGICIPVLQCKFIEEILRAAPKPLPDSVTQYIRKSYCGTFHGQHYACCEQRNGGPRLMEKSALRQTSERLPVVPRGAEKRPGVEPNHRLSRTGMSMLNSEDAECNVARILVSNGKDTDLMEFKWVVLLVYDDGVSRTLECGGSLISDRYVLTAAHCILVRDPKKLVSVRLGEYDIGSEVDCAISNDNQICAPPIQEIDIDVAVYHQNYVPSRFANDIGLLRLLKQATFNSAVHPICLPIESRRKDLPLALIVAGWGNTEKGARSNILQKASLPVVESDTCQKIYKIISITDKHLCAGGVNATQSCRGDSGGPLFEKSQRVQHGIVSGGSRKCGTNFPDVYTRVEPFLPWISSNIAALM